MTYLKKRGKWYHFKRRIPKIFRHLYGDQDFVNAALKTDSQSVALERAHLLNQELEKLWHQAASDEAVNIQSGMDRAIMFARLSGFQYRSTEELAKGDINKIVSRLMRLEDEEPSAEQVSALLGHKNGTTYPISQANKDFIDFERLNLIGKNDDQLRKWANPRNKAVNNFIKVVGDKDVSLLTRSDILAFRQHWAERIKEDGLTANSANKDLSYVRQVLAYARDDKQHDINVAGLFERVRFTETKATRPPFPTEFIQNKLLDLNNLGGLNTECRYFLFAMADTGARISELVGLDGQNNEIRLDTDIPHITIQPNTIRTLKTAQSERQIPLTGASLYAFQQLSEGFSHYLGKADLLSSTLNKYLDENELLPTSKHSVYSLRHSFEDRLTEVNTPDKIMAALMGHQYSRERYGKGPSLSLKKSYLDQICFDVS